VSGVDGAAEDGSLNDDELIAAASAGDVRAYEELVRRHEALAFRCAFLIVGDAEEARDATQDAFVRAFHALGRFRAGEAFRPWLLTIVGNQARNRRRSANRRAGLVLRAGRELGATAPSAEEATLVGERRAELLRAIEQLRVEDREVIAMRWFAELSEAEMSGVLNCPRGTVKSRLGRAMGRLRTTLLAAKPSDQAHD